jgi:hypothetical protein
MHRSAIVLVVALLAVISGTPPSTAAPCGTTAAECGLRQRIAVAEQYLQTRPGTVGFVLRDRATGATYRNADAATPIWTASTIKLAMVADLLTRQRAGVITLTDADRRLMVAMLRNSDNDAADALWTRYGGESNAFNANFPRYGMPNVVPQRGFSEVFPYWGFQKATADDLDGLMNYVLTGLSPADATAVVAEMQRVDPDQQWGVWGAGPAMTPGNKNGWSQEQGGWVVNSVGFAGAQQRYTLAIMNALGDEGGYDDGVATTTQLSRILLAP